jgi:hypothetical protein
MPPKDDPLCKRDAKASCEPKLLIPLRCLPYPSQLMLQVLPALRPVPGLLIRIPLGQSPSLHFLRRPQRTDVLVRKLHRYYFRLSDFPRPFIAVLLPQDSQRRPLDHHPKAKRGTSRFPSEKLVYVHRFSDHAGSSRILYELFLPKNDVIMI